MRVSQLAAGTVKKPLGTRTVLQWPNQTMPVLSNNILNRIFDSKSKDEIHLSTKLEPNTIPTWSYKPDTSLVVLSDSNLNQTSLIWFNYFRV